MRKALVAIIVSLVVVVGGVGLVTAHDPANDIAVRDNLIREQEALLNTYRCMFKIDTQLVRGGCAAQPPADTPSAPPQRISEWEYFADEDVNGPFSGYTVKASRYDTAYSDAWLIFGCYTRTKDRYVRINTSDLLHGDDNKADVVYRTSSEATPTRQTWYSNEEFDSAVLPFSHQEAEFIRRVAADNSTLFMSFISRYDNDISGATFPTTGANQIYSALGC